MLLPLSILNVISSSFLEYREDNLKPKEVIYVFLVPCYKDLLSNRYMSFKF